MNLQQRMERLLYRIDKIKGNDRTSKRLRKELELEYMLLLQLNYKY